MTRLLGWLLVVAGLAGIAASVFSVDRGAFVVPFAMVAGVGFFLAFGVGDVLGGHPEDERERLAEERRRRGAAGWQKPVAPPREGSRPRGLPPRDRER